MGDLSDLMMIKSTFILTIIIHSVYFIKGTTAENIEHICFHSSWNRAPIDLWNNPGYTLKSADIPEFFCRLSLNEKEITVYNFQVVDLVQFFTIYSIDLIFPNYILILGDHI